ncbi:hypothetical protein AMS68_007587 [Peltaster fructicola]|uniref:Uncharacterized protein n=1 Tax=Peltaster fructicola TaxID=286661 RepID=A0A6H0Y643_9PEZI|nr:hypothetical protein AMS68_007587 [Peltaster fructicola]
MPAPRTPKQRPKEAFARDLKNLAKTVSFSETTNQSRLLAPNIRSIAWSPTGICIATALARNIRIWNPEAPDVRQSTEIRNASNVGNVEKLAFCPTYESILASTGQDGSCRLWDVRTPGGVAVSGRGTKLAECKTGDTGLFLTWHPNGHELLVGRKDDTVQLVDTRRMTAPGGEPTWETSVQEKTPEKDMGQFNGMAFSNSGSKLFVTTGEGPIKILDWPSLDTIRTLRGHTSATNTVQHSPTGAYIAVGGNDSIITLWDTEMWYSANSVMSHAGSVRDVSFSFDGNYIVAGSGLDAREGAAGLQITHVDSGEDVITMDTQNPVSWAAWHPFRYWIAYTGDAGGLKIINAGSTYF